MMKKIYVITNDLNNTILGVHDNLKQAQYNLEAHTELSRDILGIDPSYIKLSIMGKQDYELFTEEIK